ncbi:MAG: nitroreductase family protein, partial [Acidimicrobiales bacterium]|nr:nitroreductase family protein [Acidimicrobiales bacterium]
MPFDTGETDRLLSTTRSVRRRLDLERPVPEQLLLDCIDLAEQAPTGGNQASRRWLVIRDPKVKQQVADLYREAGGAWLSERASALAGSGDPRERAARSGGHLADHLHEVPAIVLVTIYGEHDGSGRPGLFDSVIQAAWSFCLAARSRGLGTAWTTLHLGVADKVAGVLDIPEGVTQIVLLPVAFTTGDDFAPVERRPAREITWFDKWGRTLQNPIDGRPPVHADGAGITVEVDVDAKPADLWPFVSDIDLPARFSDEFQGAEWIDDEPAVGSRFLGRNRRDDLGEWEVTCTIVDYEHERVFAWHAGDPDNPAAQWRFEVLPLLGGTRLRFSMVLGPGTSGLTLAIDAMPDKEAAIIANRQKGQIANMRRTAEGIRDLAEAAGA